jgi:hypothetical protein
MLSLNTAFFTRAEILSRITSNSLCSVIDGREKVKSSTIFLLRFGIVTPAAAFSKCETAIDELKRYLKKVGRIRFAIGRIKIDPVPQSMPS